VDLWFSPLSRFPRPDRARRSRVSRYPKGDSARSRTSREEKTRGCLLWFKDDVSVKFGWSVFGSMRSSRWLMMSTRVPRHTYLVLLHLKWWPRYELRHLSYDRWTSVGIWGVTDCPLKHEVRDNMMTEVLYQLMTWTERRRNRSRAAQITTNNNI